MNYTDKLIGWRGWYGDGSALYATWKYGIDTTIWKPGVNVARCKADIFDRKGLHLIKQPPIKRCNCGLYGHSKFDYIQGNFVGMISAWGEIMIHRSRGFRAQYAQILCLSESDALGEYGGYSYQKCIERISRNYGIPLLSSLEECLSYAKEFGLEFKDHPVHKDESDKQELEDVIDVMLGT